MTKLHNAQKALNKAKSIAVLTGAGISQESGIPTFRAKEGLWRNYHPEELATPQAYKQNPHLVWEWYKMRFDIINKAKPNQAHKLLKQLENQTQLTIVTQNVDGLHTKANSSSVLELHGNLTQSRCENCHTLSPLQPNFDIPPKCKHCNTRARPNVVWFGESLDQNILSNAINAFTNADLALIIGTSAVVEPAASLARLAKQQGTYLIEINPNKTPLSNLTNLSLQTTASQGLSSLLNPHSNAAVEKTT